MKEKRKSQNERIQDRLHEAEDKIQTLNTDVTGVFDRVSDNEADVDKLKQSYFTAGNGIVITDNRPMGMDAIDISVNPLEIPTKIAVDDLIARVDELEKINKILAQHIWTEAQTRTASQMNKPKTMVGNPKLAGVQYNGKFYK